MEKQTKLILIESLNWDSDFTNEELYENIFSQKNAFMRESFFLKSLERMAWHNLVPFWDGIENCNELYTEKVRRGLRSDEFRQKYDFVFGLLRKQSVQVPEWDSEYCRKLKETFLSDRWNRP